MQRRRFQRQHPRTTLLVSHLCGVVMLCGAAERAQASCAEDITRIQLALPKAAPEIQSRLNALVTEAETKAKAKDSAGCEAATAQALQALQLPVLPPLQLSTPMAGPSEPARANQPSDPAASTTGASADPRTGAQAAASAAAPNPGAATSTAAPAGVAARTARQTAGPGAQVAAAPARDQVGAAGSQAQSGTLQPQQSAQTPQAQPPQAQGAPQQGGNAQPADQTGSGVQQAGAGGQDSPSFVSTRELVGVEVRDRDNYSHALGRVASVILERETGRALYFVLEWGGFLGWDRNRIVIPFSLLNFAGQWDRPTLNVPAGKIENAPQIQDRQLDALLRDPDWRRAVAAYFGAGHSDSVPVAAAPAPPSGPREPVPATPAGPAGHVASGPTVPSNPTGPINEPRASPGEGATGPTAGSGHPAASVTTTLAAPPAAPGGADPNHGQTLAQRACAACHTLNQGGPARVGPNLFGVADRPIASVPGYNYSAALNGHQGTWDEGNLDAFLENPRAYAPGTFMTYAGIVSDRDRRDVVAYLESLKAGGAK